MSFHVDYWNYIGWTDPFSSPQYSRRQREYARSLGSSVYTPQAVVNGLRQGVGSNHNKMLVFLEEARSSCPSMQLQLKADLPDSGLLKVHYRANGKTDLGGRVVLSLAITQNEAVSRVNRGENSGHTLKHINVVRAFQDRALKEVPAGGTIEFSRQSFSVKAADLKKYSLIGWLQYPRGRILAAQRLAL